MDRFSDRNAFAGFLTRAGFGDVNVESISFTCHLRDVDALWTLAMGSFARASSLIRAQSAEMQEAVRSAVAEAAQPYAQADGLHIPIAFLVASGARRG